MNSIMQPPQNNTPSLTSRNKVGYQRVNGRWEARYRPQCRFELIEDEITKPAFKGYKDGVYKYEFLEYFDTLEEKDAWLKSLKDDFNRRKQESDPANEKNKRKIDTNRIIISQPKIEDSYELLVSMVNEHVNNQHNTAEGLQSSSLSSQRTINTNTNNSQQSTNFGPPSSQNQKPLSSFKINSASVQWVCTACNMCFSDPSEHSLAHKKMRKTSITTSPSATTNYDYNNNATTSPNFYNETSNINNNMVPNFPDYNSFIIDDGGGELVLSPTTTITSSEGGNEMENYEILDGLFDWVASQEISGLSSKKEGVVDDLGTINEADRAWAYLPAASS